jgi:cardiolipin synthase A/B
VSPLAAALLEEIGQAGRNLPAASVERLAAILDGAVALTDSVEAALLAAVVQPASKERVRRLCVRGREASPPVPPMALAWALRAASAGDAFHRAHQRIDLVWTGPATLSQGVYRTHQTLLELIDRAARSLLVVTFAAYKVEDVRRALRAAAARGVEVTLVVETDEGPGGKIDASPLRELGGSQSGVEVYEWPVEARARDGARYGTLHAKCALADDEALLVSSANLTGSALALNMELGLLLRGGPVPAQTGHHFRELIRMGVLRRL